MMRRAIAVAGCLILCLPLSAQADTVKRRATGFQVTTQLSIYFNQKNCGGHTKYQITSFKGEWTRYESARDVTAAHFYAVQYAGATCANGGGDTGTAGTDKTTKTWDPIFTSSRNTDYVEFRVSWPYRGTPSTVSSGTGFYAGGYMHSHIKNTSTGANMGTVCAPVSVANYTGTCH